LRNETRKAAIILREWLDQFKGLDKTSFRKVNSLGIRISGKSLLCYFASTWYINFQSIFLIAPKPYSNYKSILIQPNIFCEPWQRLVM